MKAKRRHELQHNTLDAELEKTVKFFRKHGWTIISCILAACVVWIGVTWWQSGKAADRAKIENRFDEAYVHVRSGGTSEKADAVLAELDDLIDQDTVPRVSVLARLAAGDMCASLARQAGGKLGAAGLAGAAASEIGELGKTFNAKVDRARRYYNGALEAGSDEQILVARAHLGLATLVETEAGILVKADQRKEALGKALAKYREVAAMSAVAGSPVAFRADSAIKRLTDDKGGDIEPDYISPVRMATTIPAEPETQPASQPASQPATQPTSKPASQPASKPASQPASKPATQPASKPATQPASKPATQPASKPATPPVKTP